MLKKTLFIIWIFTIHPASAMETIDEFLPESSDDNKFGKQLVSHVRKALHYELLWPGSLAYNPTQNREVRHSLPSHADLETSSNEDNIERSQSRGDYFKKKSELFSDESFLMKCIDATLERCKTGIDKFLAKTQNNSEEIYGIGQCISDLLLERSMKKFETEENRSLPFQLPQNKQLDQAHKDEATLKLFHFIQLLDYCKTNTPIALDTRFELKVINLKAREPFHYIRDTYLREKESVLSDENLKKCHLGYTYHIIIRLCQIGSNNPEVGFVLQRLINVFPEIPVADSTPLNWTIDYMNSLLSDETYRDYKYRHTLDFSTWAAYVGAHLEEVTRDTKLWQLYDAYLPCTPEVAPSPQLTRSDGYHYSSAPATPTLSKASPPASRKGLMNSMKQKVTERTISSGTLQLPRSSYSQTPTSPLSPKSPKKDSTSPRASLSESWNNVVTTLSRASDSLKLPKSPTFSRSPSPRRKKEVAPAPPETAEVHEVTPAATAGLRDAGRFVLDVSQDGRDNE